MKYQHKAWVIDTCYDQGHKLIGQFWWFRELCEIPFHMLGTKISLFRTEQDARDYLPNAKKTFPKAKVKRATVTIET